MKKVRSTVLSIIIYIFLILIVLMTFLPLGWILSTSLKPSIEIFANPPYWIPHNLTLYNYYKVLFTSSIPLAFLNSVIVGIVSALSAILVGGSAGYAFARFKFRGSKSFSLFILISQMLPLTVLMIPLYYMENSMGLIDTKTGLVIAHLVIVLPLVTWMSKGYFEGIPKEIEEAAKIDGCNTLQTLIAVVLPLVKPAIAATGIYAFISSWNEFTLANVITRSMNSETVSIALFEFSTFYRTDWGCTMAASALITVPVIIVFMCVQKNFVAGLASGAVKG